MAPPSEPTTTSPGRSTTVTVQQVCAALAGRFAVERELGRGGRALVFLARDLEHDRIVALKVIRPELGSAVSAKRFLREISFASKLQHPCIVPVLDSGVADGLLYYVMPCIDGESLRARLRREGQLPLDQAVQITRDVASALGHAHRRGMVHRDIKPENILFSGGRALVADFGIARELVEDSGALSRERPAEAGLAGGTPAYMSPEQVSGSRRVDRRTDIYSLGCVLYEMLGAEPPYTGPTPQAVIAKLLREPVPHVRALREGLPAAVEQAVARALAKAPADRFTTAEEFVAALAAGTVSATTAPDALAPTPPSPTIEWPRRRWALATVGLVTVAAVGAALLLRHSPAAPVAAVARITSPDTRRVVVAVFANQTGDPSLDPLGDIAADYLARGLAETRVVEVLDARAAQPGDSATHAGGLAGARALAHALGAGSVLWGSYARRGDSLEFKAQLTDAATGKPLAAVLPAAGPTRQQTRGVEALRQHVMTALAERFDPRLASFTDVRASHAVSYEAYRAFMAGDYRRAYALDSNFTLPIVAVAAISGMGGECGRTDSIADALRPRHDRLPPFDRARLDWNVAACHGQAAKALETVREAMAVAPRSDWLAIRYAYFARHDGLLREAIAVTEKLDRARNEHDKVYWGNLVIPYHLLGEHQRELEAAQQARRLFPGDLETLTHEAYALVGLGRLAEAKELLDEMMRLPLEVSQVGWLSLHLDWVGRDLRAHGYRQEAQAVFDRGIRWIRAKSAGNEDSQLKVDLAQLLYDAERWDDARQVLKQLSTERSEDIRVKAMVGAVAARQGNQRAVVRIDRWLAEQKGPYLNGAHTYARARIAAILGDRDRAVELYRQALDEGAGLEGGYGVHSDPDFESVRDYPPFQELTRPKD